MSAQDLLHRRGEVVVAQPAKDPAKAGERQFVRFQERLLRRVRESAVEGRSAGHAAHRKHLQLRALAGQIGVSFVPIHLRFHAPVVALRHEDFPRQQPQGELPLLHVLAHRPLRDRAVRQLLAQPRPDPVRRVPLLARRLPIAFQDLVDERDRRLQLPARPFRSSCAGFGNALPIASRTIRRCTLSFLATPAIVPTPNSYSRRISSNSSTLALQSNGLPRSGYARFRVPVRCQGGPNQTAELGQFRLTQSASRSRPRINPKHAICV